MSRIANNPLAIPKGVEVDIADDALTVKGGKGELRHARHSLVNVERRQDELRVSARGASKAARSLAGTTRALLQNMLRGVDQGFEIRLEIVGVGYRAQAQGRKLNLTLGFSHAVSFQAPEGVSIETPSQTEIVIKGADRQQVGQAAADIRAYRPPEPYKGKGVRYAAERIVRKEAKKA